MDYTPERVVSLQPSATVILRDLGKLSALVACTKYCLDVCLEIDRSQVAIVADSWTAQAAQISQLKPELVIASVPYQEKALAEIMKCGARFLGLAPKLVAAGVPAVLAMQDLVPIKTATEFSATFYRELLEYGQVDRASNAARSCPGKRHASASNRDSNNA